MLGECGMLDEELTERKTYTKEEQIPVRNTNDANIFDKLNSEAAQRWYLKAGRTYQIKHNEDIVVSWKETYIQLDPLNP